MTLYRPALLGIIFGLAIGGGYITLQRWELRHRSKIVQPKGPWVLIPGALIRLALLIGGLLCVLKFTEADKCWLTGALLVTYTAPLLVQLKQMIFPKR